MSPIVGLTRTDDPTKLAPAEGLPYLGAIHLGAKRTPEMIEKNQAGPDLEYFRVEFAERYESLRGAFERIYGSKPLEFDPVLLFGNTPDEAFPTWMIEKGMKGQRITGVCNGQQRVMWIDERYNVHDTRRSNSIDEPLACRADKSGACKFCKPNGTMKVLLLELYRQTGQYGYFQLSTGSKNNIARISAALVTLAPLASLEGFAFRLGRTPGQHSGWRSYEKGGEAKLTETKHALLYLEPTAQSATKITAMLAERTGISMPALPPPQSAEFALSEATGNPLLDYGVEPPAAVEDDVQDGEYTEQDGIHAEAAENAVTGLLRCHSVFVGFDKKTQGYYYVLRCNDAQNFTVDYLNLFMKAGVDVTNPMWTTANKVVVFEPPILLEVDEQGVVLALKQEA